MNKLSLLLSFLILISFNSAHAVHTELGTSFSYRKTSYDKLNYTETQSTTGSVSMYFWERVGLEMSYTEGRYDKVEESASLAKRTSSQKMTIYGTDIVLGFSDRKSAFQPYAKVGMAYTKKELTIIDTQSASTFEIPFEAGWAPSYGVGLKMFITQDIAIRLSYDTWTTPSGNSNYSDSNDTAGRVGITWTL